MATAIRVTSARLVGRTAELAELEAVVEDAGAGRPSLAFVAGESGVGKTRLTDELARRARERGVRVLSGDCVELGEGELPYAPLVGALRPLVRDGDPVVAELPPTLRTELAAILPTLGAAAPDADTAPQSRLFEALIELFDRLAEDQALLLIVEDLHWADRSTRAFLSFLARTICAVRIAVVATYRSDELHRRHPLRPVLAELERDPRSRRIDLRALTRDELAEQLGDILGATPDPGLVERVHARSEGNPLFTEEILAAGLDGRGSLPPTLRDALMLRIERLPAESQELLRLLVAQPMDHKLLAEVSGLHERALRDALREAFASHIVVAGDDDRYRFRHALLREVLLDDLLPGERTGLHRSLAQALQRRADEEGAGAYLTAQIAHHWLHAGDQPAALSASLRAATEAERVNAFGEAAALLERALELWERVPEAEQLAGCDRADLLVRTSVAAGFEGDHPRQEALLKKALSIVDETAEPRRAAVMLEQLQRAQLYLNRPDESIATIDRALALLPADERSPERIALLAGKARVRMLQSRFREAVELARETLALAEEAGDHAVASRVRNALGVALVGMGEAQEGEQALREALAIARAHELIEELGMAYGNLADALHMVGRTNEAMETARAGRGELTGIVHQHDWLTLDLIQFAIASGDWETAEREQRSLDRRYDGRSLLHRHLNEAHLALGRGDHETARQQLDAAHRAARDSAEPQFLGPLGALRGELERRTGDLDAARGAIDEALDRIEFCSDDITQVTGVAAVGIRIEADAAQRARDRDDIEAQREAKLRAELLFARVEAGAELERPPLVAELAVARAEDARAHGEDDPMLWAEAATEWRELGRPYFEAYARWREADAALGRGDRKLAAEAARAAGAIARALGAVWLLHEVEGLAARGRLRLDDGAGTAPAASAAPAGVAGSATSGGTDGVATADEDDPFGLTPRERQVLVLLAQGATNREIGTSLYMAEKTASVHVSRILAKLDVRSRTQAAAVAHRLGVGSG